MLIGAVLLNGVVPARARGARESAGSLVGQGEGVFGGEPAFEELLLDARGAEFLPLLGYVLGESADEAKEAVEEGAGELFRAAASATTEKVEGRFEERLKSRRDRPGAARVSSGGAQLPPGLRGLDWRALAFGFRPLAAEEPRIDVRQTGAQVTATGSDRKTVETENGTVTRSNKVETKAIDDGKVVGVEYKTTEVVEAKSRTENKGFRKETVVNWRVEVAACPDADGVVAGTATETVSSKNLISEPTGTTQVVRDVTVQMTLKGYVNDDAEMTHYDMEGEVVENVSGFKDASDRGLIKDAAQKDGTTRVLYDFKENKAGTNDSTDRGIVRTPPKVGKVSIKPGANTSLEEARRLDKTSGKLIGTVWDAANTHYQRARSNWRNYGCVEVACTAAKTVLKPGEEIEVTAEATQTNEKSPVSGLFKASGFESVTPEEQRGAKASFVLTARGEDGDNPSTISVESISKRGIGLGGLDFGREQKREEPEETGCGWTGTITAERSRREEREKRSGDNLAENGGHLETKTTARLQLGGRRDRSEGAANIFFGRISGEQESVDYEYDKYKIDEGYCGANAVPYKAPSEKTRTSRTAGTLSGEVRVFIDIGHSSGSVNFSLPETLGKTVHSYVHKSACPEHDRANTNQAVDEGVPLNGGSFSVTFPVDPGKQMISGSVTVREEDGAVTVYSYRLTRCAAAKATAKGGR